MATSSVTGSTNTNTSGAIQSALNTTTDGTTAAEMQTKFLNLLVTQLKNQDPLNPMDNAQMTTQLAQISTVSGLEKLNATLATLLQSYTASQNMQAASLIGHAVLTEGNTMTLGASGAVAGLTLDKAADAVTVTIKDANGNTVHKENLGAMSAGTSNFVWDGKDMQGNALAEGGEYTFSVEATKNGEVVTSKALQAGMVNAVTLGTDGMTLELGTGDKVSYSSVKQIL